MSSELAQAADVVLPGAAFVEKDAVFTNADNRVQAASRAIAPPGDARDDWQILVGVARALGLSLPYNSSADVRSAIAAAFPSGPYESLDRMVFTRPVAASHWLQSSNPSERWKWDFMYQDLPPVKFEGRHGLSSLLAAIPMKEVKLSRGLHGSHCQG